ncbi:conserved exported hypothetical protein [Vibrio crassostreae]|uniref:Uncharacterized protein n=1 Tax=Vibrio crassostreae TaxID=246167 RepID=A0A822MYE4_9VIBR|nr:hypothetical protein [Vibrio crassostreae]MDH5953278.1 hypothetical protein [Vibrio crassostreae]TCM98389.1 hypothetical protein EDB35_1525 [Vibrio crassostreae]CAK1758163.1 conserved exported hypothetical protein [Vibrio crassostreae]CAK1972356.1 conserved exported hypothetical protein [Vibrio crassostreae]CAK2048735.1 conserved exported hypothetical protein [Vibrio crassostreae]
MRYLLSLLLVATLTGCGTVPMAYQPKDMSLDQAYVVVEQMVMTQHRNWKPDYFVMTEHYIGWDFGTVSKSVGTGTSFGNSNAIVIASSNTTTRNVGERVYYNQIEEIKLLSWKRKFKQWYVVSLTDLNGRVLKHIVRTRQLRDAEFATDALNVILKDRQATN